jgi:hypothetical protein
MTNEPNKEVYDLESVCTLCVCSPANHILFWPCPILSNEKICTDCCQVSCLKDDIAIKFSQALGKEITLEEVNKACQSCGKNYGKQNPELAKRLENEF